ncbi:MAG: tetratricopeptide repeat protein [Bacteroidales bacterium]|nr:tetratricopeptide repeat protein [Bacteroidales bacterium]
MTKRTFLIFLLLLSTAMALTSCKNKGEQENIDASKIENLSDRIKYLYAEVDKNPENADLRYQLGKALIEEGRSQNQSQFFKDAIVQLKKATQLDKSKPDYFTALADAYFSIGDVNNSYDALQEALSLDDNNFEARLKLGEIAFYSRNYELAMENLNYVTAQDKDNQTALYMKGFIYKFNGDTSNAVYYFRRIIELYPDYEPAYEELGMLYSTYRNKLGLEYLESALALQPNNINVLYGIAQLYQDVEDAENAERYYVKILEIDPQFKYAWFCRGRIELELYNDYENAAEFFSKAIDCDPQFAEAHYNRGLAYELMGNKRKADECYKTARELGLNDEDIIHPASLYNR